MKTSSPFQTAANKAHSLISQKLGHCTKQPNTNLRTSMKLIIHRISHLIMHSHMSPKI